MNNFYTIEGSHTATGALIAFVEKDAHDQTIRILAQEEVEGALFTATGVGTDNPFDPRVEVMITNALKNVVVASGLRGKVRIVEGDESGSLAREAWKGMLRRITGGNPNYVYWLEI